jgi:RNA polymerase sigma-54 factor
VEVRVQFQRPALAAVQRQKLSPQMIQSIKLMAMPILELKEQIQQELESNPALEVVEDASTISLEIMSGGDEPGQEREEFFENASDPGFASRSNADDDSRRMFLEGAISRAETLQEHLLSQLRIQRIEPRLREIGEALIQNLDNDGFHTEDPHLLFSEAEAHLVDEAMNLIRTFDPAGCCTRGFRESLLVQASLESAAPKSAIEILSDHMELLEKGRHSEIQKRLKLDEAELKAALVFIKGLSPFPGRAYSTAEPRFVIPDLLVKLKDGDFVIVLNDEEIPVLGIDPFFDRLADEGGTDRSTATYVKDNIKRARFFIRSIHQRNQTLLKVARAVVEHQREFFAGGPRYLSPLTLRDVAREIGVHETTVSRIAHSKHLQTDWGIFEFRYFFSNSISGAGSSGSRFSKEGVKTVIREIIEQEESSLSDRDIVDHLAKRGIALARRTVAKYRQELDLDSSFGRKKEG